MANKKAIIRLSRYKTALYRLKDLGISSIFSTNIAKEAGATPEQVRKDFSIFGVKGHKKAGYKVDSLLEQLKSILGKEKTQQVIVVGAGNIGTSIIKYKGFRRIGIRIAAGFDIDVTKMKTHGTIPVLPMSRMIDFVQKQGVKIGIITVPNTVAQQVFDQMVLAGIKGVLNLVPVTLRAPKHVVVNDVDIAVELENVIYYVLQQEKHWEASHETP